jgi:hypothetical protein
MGEFREGSCTGELVEHQGVNVHPMATWWRIGSNGVDGRRSSSGGGNGGEQAALYLLLREEEKEKGDGAVEPL